MRGRGSAHGAAGEPCLVPLRMSDKGLLSDARKGDLQQMKKHMRNSMFKKIEDINQRDERHCTPLHYAAKNGHCEMIKFILDKRGDLSAQDKHGWSVLQYAVRYADVATMKLLLDLGCDLAHKEKKGWTCLHLAARNGQPDKARFLLEHGADVGETQNQGWNALHLAVRYGQPDTISILLEYGIDINARNHGWGALHLAALNGHTDIVSILLNKGAETEAVNEEGRTPLDIARQEQHDRIVAIILEAEFQSGRVDEVGLPSPPPTPPSAPPLELAFDDAEDETLTEWSTRIRGELEEVDGDCEEGEDDVESKIATLDVRFAWKTFEEEAKELMSQLDRLRLQNVNKVKAQIVKARREGEQKLQRLDKQKRVLETQIKTLSEDGIPQIQKKFERLVSDEHAAVAEIEALLINCHKEKEAMFHLRSLSTENKFLPECQAAKCRAMETLEQAQCTEANLLADEKRQRESNAVTLVAKKDSEIQVAHEKLRILQENVTKIEQIRREQAVMNEQMLQDLNVQLEKAERKSLLKGPDEEEHWFGCPVCLTLLRPPMRIFQCPEGHILCEECKENPAMVHCPQCRCSLEGQCSRNRALEEVARSYFPMAPSETL